LAAFLRKQRGELSVLSFAKKTGLSHTTLRRIEQGEQSLSLDKVQTVIDKLKIKLSDVFPEEF
jgi:transcriptional regulator with XRE-family HTH domain